MPGPVLFLSLAKGGLHGAVALLSSGVAPAPSATDNTAASAKPRFRDKLRSESLTSSKNPIITSELRTRLVYQPAHKKFATRHYAAFLYTLTDTLTNTGTMLNLLI